MQRVEVGGGIGCVGRGAAGTRCGSVCDCVIVCGVGGGGLDVACLVEDGGLVCVEGVVVGVGGGGCGEHRVVCHGAEPEFGVCVLDR